MAGVQSSCADVISGIGGEYSGMNGLFFFHLAPSRLKDKTTRFRKCFLCDVENITPRNSISLTNQSVEKAGVAFVKGANERNEFFEKINKG